MFVYILNLSQVNFPHSVCHLRFACDLIPGGMLSGYWSSPRFLKVWQVQTPDVWVRNCETHRGRLFLKKVFADMGFFIFIIVTVLCLCAYFYLYIVSQQEQSDQGLHCLPRVVCPNS